MPGSALRRLALAILALQFGCDQPPPVPTTPTLVQPQSVSLRGRVIETTTGNPVAAANVFIGRPGESLQFHGATDENGVFQVTNLKPGVMTVVIAKTGYERFERELSGLADASLDFQVVARRHVLSGRVTDITTREPLAGATITVLDGENAFRAALTGSDGAFSLRELWFEGFTVAFRQPGYDSVFRGVRLSGDTVLDVEMRRAQQSLAGTWSGIIRLGSGERFNVPEVTLSHSGVRVDATAAQSFGGFTGTLRDPARIGATTEIIGTVTWNRSTGNPRQPMTCRGTGTFSGNVNWAELRISAPHVVFDCSAFQPTSITYELVRQQ